MESEIKKKLPPIFKLSLLSRILPYYGYLHEWRKLLTMINRETEAIWEENTDTIFYIGKDFKQENFIDFSKDLKNVRKSFINLYLLKISVDYLDDDDYYYLDDVNSRSLLSLIDKLDEDETIIWDFHKSNCKDICIYYCNEDKVSKILPAVMCPSFRKTSALLDYGDKKTINEIISKELLSKSVMIEFRKNKISLYSVFSPTLRILSEDDWSRGASKLTEKMSELWQIKNCVCKPTKLQANTRFVVNECKTLNSLSWIENINDAQFDIIILSNSKKIVIENILKNFPQANLNF